jgi:hypothetical protein
LFQNQLVVEGAGDVEVAVDHAEVAVVGLWETVVAALSEIVVAELWEAVVVGTEAVAAVSPMVAVEDRLRSLQKVRRKFQTSRSQK